MAKSIRDRIAKLVPGERILEHADPPPVALPSSVVQVAPIAPAATGTMVQTVEAVVTVGPEHAALLSERLGRLVEPGEQFDLGTVSANGLPVGEHLFSDPTPPPVFIPPGPETE